MTTEMIERDAKLFEAGSYPDKGIEMSEDDLDALAAGTSQVPIRIEHTTTPFDGALGVLKSVYRKGRELFGKLCFTKSAWDLIKEANAKKLSLAIRKDKAGITEVSLVREPRIADAAVFSAGDTVQMDVDLALESFESEQPTAAFTLSPDSDSERFRRELAEKDAQVMLDELKRAGKIVPASEVFARAILRTDDSSVITFGDQPTPVSQIFRWFLDSQPNVIEFSELAAAESDVVKEPEIFSKLGVTSKQVERYKTR